MSKEFFLKKDMFIIVKKVLPLCSDSDQTPTTGILGEISKQNRAADSNEERKNEQE
jgi:hypothetical protein